MKGCGYMKELRNNVDYEAYFDELEEARKYYMPDLKEFPECSQYAQEIKDTRTLEELAEVLNKYTDEFSDGRHHFVKEF